jgi:hypothetical protein
MAHHDVWDYDLPVAPKLITVKHGGKMVDAVAQGTKFGFLFVVNRLTGEPLWPVEECTVPQSDVPGEWTSPTQPFPIGQVKERLLLSPLLKTPLTELEEQAHNDTGARLPRGGPVVTAGALIFAATGIRPQSSRVRSGHRQGLVDLHSAHRLRWCPRRL